MNTETRTVAYDEELRLEAYRFQGLARPFPNHFHEHYVLGYVESGERRLFCRGQTYTLRKGHLLLLNPGDSHACTQCDGGVLDYRGLSVPCETMLGLAEEVTGRRVLPGFAQNVVLDEEAACCLRALHEAVLRGSREFDREEQLLLLLTFLIQRYGQPFDQCIPACRAEVEAACALIHRRYAGRLTLDELCRHTGLSKSTLLRAFTRAKGVTPYCYLQSIRINEARRLLEQGVPPLAAALRTGFADQSHFTNCFTSFLGLAPGVYRALFAAHSRTGEDIPHETDT